MRRIYILQRRQNIDTYFLLKKQAVKLFYTIIIYSQSKHIFSLILN